MLIDENLRFEASFTPDGYAELMALIFEDENYTSEELLPTVYRGMGIGIQRYNDNNSDVNFITYITYYVKREVNLFKNSQ